MAVDNSRIPKAGGEAEPGRPAPASTGGWWKWLWHKLSGRGDAAATASAGLPQDKHEASSPVGKRPPPANANGTESLAAPAEKGDKAMTSTEAGVPAELKPPGPAPASDEAQKPSGEAGKVSSDTGEASSAAQKASSEGIGKPADETEKAGTPPQMPSPKPALASWQNIPAAGPWCPEQVARQWPELAEVVYQDEHAQGGKGMDGWLVAGATRRGRMHAHAGTHRDDAFAFSSGQGYSILCVADGAGSSQHSRIGSEICCREMIGQLQKTLFGNDSPREGGESESEQERVARCIGAAVKHICQRIRELAAAAGCEARDFHSTLLVAVQIEIAGPGRVYISQVGDGAICALLRTGQVQALGLADSGEYSGQVTCFVPDESAESKARRLQVFETQEIECLLLCSDGIEDPFYPMQRKARAIFQQLYLGVEESLPDFTQAVQPAPMLQADVSGSLLNWLDFKKRGENDDRTLVVLYRAPYAAVTQVLRGGAAGLD
jgi:serine/threonine protein phosphatase PrpC